MNLGNFIRVGRYDLPLPAAGSTNDLALEVSALTYNWDTGTLFLLGDEGTSIVEVSKTGALISTMALPAGAIADPEGLTYVGNGAFVLVEERTRVAIQFTYEGGTTLDAAALQRVELGTPVGNIGLEGIALDPLSSGFVLVKEISPQGIFATTIDFAAGIASNGSAATVNPVNLFEPALVGALDFADVFALSVLPGLAGTPFEDDILILSQESASITQVNRDGSIVSTLNLVADAGNPLSIAAQGHEGLTMDRDGFLYVVGEQAGGSNIPQLWVFQLATFQNTAPTGITLANPLTTLAENTSTATRLKVADLVIADDGIGNNLLSIRGADAPFFEVDATGLYLRSGVLLDFETRASFSITVSVDDPAVGATPDASTTFSLTVQDVVNESPARGAFISEVAPWASGNSAVGVDWFELTNTSPAALGVAGWRVDDGSASFGLSAPLAGITSIAPGESVIFLETSAANFSAARAAFSNVWFGGTAPAGLQFGHYSGAGLGLGTGGDGVTVFDGAGTQMARVSFGASPSASPFATFENSAAQDSIALTSLSAVGVAGAFSVAGVGGGEEIGSPGTVGKLFVSEAAPWASGTSNSPVRADWFELTNTTSGTASIAGLRFDDDSASFAESDPLMGVTSLAAGASAIFLNTSAAGFAAAQSAFVATWFGGSAPVDVQFGWYEGAGLGTGGDQVNIFDATGNLVTGLIFGAATPAPALATFDNAAAVEFQLVTTLSSPGTNGAFQVANSFGNTETGSPGAIATVAPPVNLAPSAIQLSNVVASLAEGVNTPVRLKLADVAILDDGLGFNALSLSGADAGLFEINAGGLFLRAFTNLDFEARSSYSITIEASDPTLPGAPHATLNFALAVTDVAHELRGIAITEVAPWASGNSPVRADWFEITNFGATTKDLSGWAFDDDSASLAEADPLLGVSAIAPGQSVVFLNTNAAGFAAAQSSFVATWFGGAAPVGLAFGHYDGAGLGAGGDSVVLFDAAGTIQASLGFGASPSAAPFATFDNAQGEDNVRISGLSVPGANGAFAAAGAAEIGSPGRIAEPIDPPMVLRGGAGADTIAGGNSADRLHGGSGNDGLAGRAGNDRLDGEAGEDRLEGGAGDDRLFGGLGADTLNGGDGNDVLYGGRARDGGVDGEADLFVFDLDDGSDRVFGFEEGIDKVQLAGGTDFTLAYTRSATILTFGDTEVRFFGAVLAEDDFVFAI